MESTTLNVNFKSILDIICKDIYDSPLSLLRENVQNAYDAILMRMKADNNFNAGRIDVVIDGKEISIADNGIGMDYDNLSKNYWSAGCSGKNNDLARSAGVVGTFGIGAMANFGVCTELSVTTRRIGDNPIIYSVAQRGKLSVTDRCIDYRELEHSSLHDFGTIVHVTLDASSSINPMVAKDYLTPYVKYLPVPVYINGELISTNSYWVDDVKDGMITKDAYYSDARFRFDYKVRIGRNSVQKVCPQIFIENILDYNKPISGNLWLYSEVPSIFGFRNSFGLAIVPVSSAFNFGGVANLGNLTPTAGRDAVNRESVLFVSRLTEIASSIVAETIADTEMADASREFLSYVRNSRRYELAGKVKISICKSDERYELRSIKKQDGDIKSMYYQGNDKTVMDSFSDPHIHLFIPANDNTRKNIQLWWLRNNGIDEVPDDITITNEITNDKDLSKEEFSIKFRIERILDEDYLMPQTKVIFADVSHGLNVHIIYNDPILTIYLKRNSEDQSYLKKLYNEDYSMFEPFVKEFVRTTLYPKFASYLPSSKKYGAETLYKIMQQRKELYTIESSDQGNMDYVMGEYLKGRASFDDVLKAAQKTKTSQTQTVDSGNVGQVQDVVGKLATNTSPGNNTGKEDSYDALPPIVVDIDAKKYKLLRCDNNELNLQGYHTFLALSDKMFKENKDFFMSPHSTKVIWSTHKIIYIFTHISGTLTLYYDIDLNKPLENNFTGGREIKTSTIVTNYRIFIPVIPEMDSYFNVTESQLKFYVRFDTVRN